MSSAGWQLEEYLRRGSVILFLISNISYLSFKTLNDYKIFVFAHANNKGWQGYEVG